MRTHIAFGAPTSSRTPQAPTAARWGRRRSSPPSASTTGRAPSPSTCPTRRSSTAATRSSAAPLSSASGTSASSTTAASTTLSSPPSSSVRITSDTRLRKLGRGRTQVRRRSQGRRHGANRPRRCCSGRPRKSQSRDRWLRRPRASTLTLIAGADSVDTREFGGRNLHFGIREHAMGAVVNGLTLPQLPGLRCDLPDLQRLHEGRDPAGGDHAWLPSIYVFTHDFDRAFGEDGLTHQPIEQLAQTCARPRTSR